MFLFEYQSKAHYLKTVVNRLAIALLILIA